MGGLEFFCLACSAENFEKVTVKGGEIWDFWSEIGESGKFLVA